MDDLKMGSPWVLFGLGEVTYAVSSMSVLSLNQIPEITQLRTAPSEVRGVINFREKVIQLIDTRTLFNIKPIPQEIIDFSKMMDQRLQDHINWVNTLQKNVTEDMQFTLTTDPHKCAFGKWYDSYSIKSTNILFLSTFAKFDVPHKAIHHIAITAEELIKQGKKDEAISLIESVKDTELKQMLHLFDEIKGAYRESQRETIAVLGSEQRCVGITVDKIIAIENLFEIDENFLKESLTSSECLSAIAKRKDGSVVFLLNDDFILSQYH